VVGAGSAMRELREWTSGPQGREKEWNYKWSAMQFLLWSMVVGVSCMDETRFHCSTTAISSERTCCSPLLLCFKSVFLVSDSFLDCKIKPIVQSQHS
jgi:hypothetical protein